MARGMQKRVEAGICPDCKKRVKFIISHNGSRMAVNPDLIAIWTAPIGETTYSISYGYRTHNYTCMATGSGRNKKSMAMRLRKNQ